jgi:hypothetical protein
VRIRIDGVKVSSNWPDLTHQMNPNKKASAIPRLARMSMSSTATV